MSKARLRINQNYYLLHILLSNHAIPKILISEFNFKSMLYQIDISQNRLLSNMPFLSIIISIISRFISYQDLYLIKIYILSRFISYQDLYKQTIYSFIHSQVFYWPCIPN